jgi:hypothetical protein
MKFLPGQPIHGYAGGVFGRDSYECRRVEAVGHDWLVTRTPSGQVGFASGDDLQHLASVADDRSYCDEECDLT